MNITQDDINRIIVYKKARLEALEQPDMWIRYTKNMESGEIREFKQSCIDDEIIIEALEKQIPKKPINTMREIVCPTCRTLVGSSPYCRYCGQMLDHTEKGGGSDA